MKKRFLSILLTFVMVIGMLPMASLTVHAAEPTTEEEFFEHVVINFNSIIGDRIVNSEGNKFTNTSGSGWELKYSLSGSDVCLNLYLDNATIPNGIQLIGKLVENSGAKNVMVTVHVKGECHVEGGLVTNFTHENEVGELIFSQLFTQIYFESEDASLSLDGGILCQGMPNLILNAYDQSTGFPTLKCTGVEFAYITTGCTAFVNFRDIVYIAENASRDAFRTTSGTLEGDFEFLRSNLFFNLGEGYVPFSKEDKIEITTDATTEYGGTIKSVKGTHGNDTDYVDSNKYALLYSDSFGMDVSTAEQWSEATVGDSIDFWFEPYIGRGMLGNGLSLETSYTLENNSKSEVLTPTDNTSTGVDKVNVKSKFGSTYTSSGIHTLRMITKLKFHDEVVDTVGEVRYILVNDSPAVLDDIEITWSAASMAHANGQEFDKSKIEVTANYSDGSSKILDAADYDVTYQNGATLKTGDTSVTISYTEDGVTKTATQTVSVADALHAFEFKSLDDLDFGTVEVGYSSVAYKNIIVKNTGSDFINLDYKISDTSKFRLSSSSDDLNAIEEGTSHILQVHPVDNLPVGVYNETIRVYGLGALAGQEHTFNLKFVVSDGHEHTYTRLQQVQ